MFSGDTVMGTDWENPSSSVLQLSAISLVETEPYVPLCAWPAGSVICVSAAADAYTADFADRDGDSFFTGSFFAGWTAIGAR